MTKIHITTGDQHLDDLLSPDTPGEDAGVMYASDGDAQREAPVILILGAAGTGKTVLSLQVATATAKKGARVFLYSLEQSGNSLQAAARSFGFPPCGDSEQYFIDFQDIVDEPYTTAGGYVYLCHFSPLPLSTRESHAAFEDRFLELSHTISTVQSDTDGGAIFIIDSLNAIATETPERADIYRLFSLFRTQHIPLVITAERQELGTSGTTGVSEAARFLADVVIELTKDSSAGHLLQYLEILKSRVQRQSLGRHLYKIRTVKPHLQPDQSPPGITVYRSMPCVISTVRKETHQRVLEEKYTVHADTDAKHDLCLLHPNPTTKAGHCFALLGPPGTHKLAVALNLAGGYRHRIGGDKPLRRLLIVSFGGTTATDLAKIAWFKERDFWRRCPPLKGKQDEKWWWASSEAPMASELTDDGGPAASADQLTFRLGHLTPEECFDCIAKSTTGNKYSAVILSDTAEIATGFPLLRRDPLFIPALIDLFSLRGLTSVCIGVEAENTPNRDMDFAIQSCADYRLRFTHYPTAYKLAEQSAKQHGRNPTLEQSVSVIADIVAGRVYSRTPHWLWVDDQTVLHCGTYAEYQKRKRSASRVGAALSR